MSGEPIKPIDSGAIPGLARHFLGGVLPLDVTIVASYYCAGCRKPHLVKIASSTKVPESVVGVLSLAIIDVIDTYSIIADEEHTSWRHHD